MTSIEFVGVQKETEKPKGKSTAFGIRGDKPSPYTVDGQVLNWQQVHDQVAMLMVEHGLPYQTVADMQRKLPQLLFMLANENETLKKQVEQPEAKKKK